MMEPARDEAPAPRTRSAGRRSWWSLISIALLLLPSLSALNRPWLRVPLAAIVSLVLMLGCGQGSLIYFPPRHDAQERPDGPAAVAVLAYQSSGAPQQAYYIPPRTPGAAGRVWLVFGGNGSSAIGWGPFVHAMPDGTASFLLIDYPGYGANGGSPSPASIHAGSAAAVAALAAHLRLSAADLAARCAVFGHSLGCAAALDYAASHPVTRIVLVAPFTSMLAMARRVLGWPLCEILVHRFDNRACLDAVIAAGPPPITIVHGTADEVIPVAMGRELASRWPAAIRLVEVPGASHNGIIDTASELIYAEMVR
jgi:pimeloyl-ACP methyl ester carboxylesterase